MSSVALKPGILLGPYPERADERRKPGEHLLQTGLHGLAQPGWLVRRQAQQFAATVTDKGPAYTETAADELIHRVRKVRELLLRTGLEDTAVAEAFALVRELASRTLGKRHYPNQIAGGWIILNGMLAEMETGEGKTLTATLPAIVAALAGIPVHIITTSDYLAERDAKSLAPLYAAFGLTVGTVTADMQDQAARRAAYACDICYCTNKQVAFDYLRDRATAGGHKSRLERLLDRTAAADNPNGAPVLRGLCFGIVDEADSVLIDEARTPLILSRQLPDIPDPIIYRQTLRLVQQLRPAVDYTVDKEGRTAELTECGRTRLEQVGKKSGGIWARRRQREGLVIEGLKAVHLFVRDEHYLVRDGAVQIIDENTGRTMQDRSWERGLHQLIEARERVEITPPTEAIARTSYQQFFRRYLRLGAMSGTASEVSTELLSTYGLQVARVPSHRPVQRKDCGTQLYATTEQKLQATIKRVRELHAAERPVLLGTRSVASSEELSELLNSAGLQHTVLNARQDQDEAAIVARAGQPGSITIATNMAGRGTDIELGPGVAENGGLHVIMTEKNDARRIDRQLYGRCGRQGDPGSYEAILSLQDKIVSSITANNSILLLNQYVSAKSGEIIWLGKGMMRLAQRRLENQHRRIRHGLAREDERISEALSFTGTS